MSICYIYNESGIKKTLKLLVKDIKEELISHPHIYEGGLSRLLSDDISKLKQISDLINSIKSLAETKGKEYEGVSHFLDLKHILSEGTEAVYLAPLYIEENYILHYIELNVQEGKAPSLAEEEVKAQIADSAIEKEMGTLLHALIQALFDNDGNSSSQLFKDVLKSIKTHLDDTTNEDGVKLENGRTLRDIVTENNKSLTDDEIVKILADNAVTVYNSIINKKDYQDAKFFAECNLYADDSIKTPDIKYKGIKGIADLIVVKKDGTVDIIDFKVCTRPYDLWVAAKLYHTEYQLGIYRLMLALHGIDGSKVGLFILPIRLDKNNAADTEVESIQNVLAMSSGSSVYSRLHWNYGNFMANIRYLIPADIEMPIETAIEVNNAALDKFNEMVDYNPVEKDYNKEELIDRKLHESIENGKKVYFFYDRYTRQRIVNPDREFFTRPGGEIDKYIKKMRNIKNDWVKDLYDAIEEYKQDPNNFNVDQFDFLKTKGRGQIETIMSTIFGEFVKPYYKPLNIPVLLENGILGFYNETTGTCNFVVVTDQSLTKSYGDGKFDSVLGNFLSNDEVRELNWVDKILPAQCQYAELLKTMHIINSIADSSPEYFKGKSIGSIQVINPEFGENNSIPLSTLMQNYSILCDKTKTKNHFLDEIVISDPWVDFGFQLHLIETMDGYKGDKKFLSFYTKKHLANTNSKFNKINELIRLRSAMEKHYPRFLAKDFIRQQKYDLNNPIDNLFVTVSELILYYQKIPVDPAGNFDKYGLNARSLMELIGIPFKNNQALGNRGFASGLFMTSAENSPSPTLRALSEYYEISFSHIRELFLKLHTIISKLTMPYINKVDSKMNQLLSGIETKKWEKLLVKDASGKFADTLMIINPYLDNSLDNETKEFLKGILWEINKFRYKELSEFKHLNYIDNKDEIDSIIYSEDAVIKLFQSGRYFELPLKRARYFERWKKVGRIGIKNLLTKELETLKDDWDLTKTTSSLKSTITKELKQNATTMYNQYDISPEDRDYIIKLDGPNDFELDLDLLAMDVAFLSIREDYYENVLQTTAAAATVLHVNLALTGINRHPELEALDIRLKTAIKNEGDITEEMLDSAKVVSALRKLNSVMVLAFRPLLLIKEITFGQFTNYSRAFGTKGSSNELSLKSVFSANKTIWGLSIGKWCSAFTSDANIGSYTLCECLNKMYGIANEDISRTVDTSMNSRFGILANPSKWMYLANSAPDYFNRLTLFVAKMMEDGCFDAHSLNKDGELIYDFKKDKRFSELVKHGLNSNYRGEEYLKQKALYIAMNELFLAEGRNYTEYDKDGNLIYKEFDRAYTTKLRNSMKEVADLAYGYYDHENKSLVDLGFFGLIYKQFLTFLTAKTNLWFKGRPSTKGDNTSLGLFKIVELNGEKCYRRIIYGENNTIKDVKIVPESQLTPEEKNTLDYAYQWQGDYVEGLAYSIMMTLHDLFRLNFSDIRNNKYRRANVALAMHDLLIGLLLFSIFKWLFSAGTNKMLDIKPLLRVMLRAMQDVSPSAITSLDWEPGFYSTVVNLRDDAIKIFSDDDPDLIKLLTRRVGAIKDWTYNND